MIYYNNSMRHFKESLIRLLYPAHCEFCGKPLALDENLLAKPANKTSRAGYPRKSLVDEQFETWITRGPSTLTTPLRELLRAVKYDERIIFSRPLKSVAKLATSIVSECVYNALIHSLS